MLVDHQIEAAVNHGRLGLSPYRDDRLQPASYDLALGPTVRVPKPRINWLNPHNQYDPIEVQHDHRWPYEYTDEVDTEAASLKPGGFLLAHTEETVRLPGTMAARVEGKSSLGRLGIMVHITAGFIDPGFEGQITLEIYNAAPWEFPLATGMLIAQLCFFDCAAPIYDYSKTGRYQGQTGPQESRYAPRG